MDGVQIRSGVRDLNTGHQMPPSSLPGIHKQHDMSDTGSILLLNSLAKSNTSAEMPRQHDIVNTSMH